MNSDKSVQLNPIGQMFDRIHARYDLLNHLLSGGLDFYWRRRAVSELRIQPGELILDLCCGTGDLSQAMHKAGGRVTGLDFSARMLARAQQKYPHLQFVQGDATQVPLTGPFDAVALAFGPRNIADLPALWRELRRLLRSGGQVMSLELTRPPGLLGWLHGLYLRHILPPLGALISGDEKAYNYLCQTITNFMNAEQLCESMRCGGLLNIRSIPLTCGIVTLHLATVP